MGKWLELARRELSGTAGQDTAKTDEKGISAVTAVSQPDPSGDLLGVFGSNGSTLTSPSGDLSGNFGSNGSTPVDGQEAERIAAMPIVPMGTEDEAVIRAWLADLGETDPGTVDEIIERCRTDMAARTYFVSQGQNLAKHGIGMDDDDNRRPCRACSNLTPEGRCLAAWRGEIAASRTYRPVADLLRRCEGYMPKAGDSDQRPGRERWPNLTTWRGNHDGT